MTANSDPNPPYELLVRLDTIIGALKMHERAQLSIITQCDREYTIARCEVFILENTLVLENKLVSEEEIEAAKNKLRRKEDIFVDANRARDVIRAKLLCGEGLRRELECNRSRPDAWPAIRQAPRVVGQASSLSDRQDACPTPKGVNGYA